MQVNIEHWSIFNSDAVTTVAYSIFHALSRLSYRPSLIGPETDTNTWPWGGLRTEDFYIYLRLLSSPCMRNDAYYLRTIRKTLRTEDFYLSLDPEDVTFRATVLDWTIYTLPTVCQAHNTSGIHWYQFICNITEGCQKGKYCCLWQLQCKLPSIVIIT